MQVISRQATHLAALLPPSTRGAIAADCWERPLQIGTGQSRCSRIMALFLSLLPLIPCVPGLSLERGGRGKQDAVLLCLRLCCVLWR